MKPSSLTPFTFSRCHRSAPTILHNIDTQTTLNLVNIHGAYLTAASSSIYPELPNQPRPDRPTVRIPRRQQHVFASLEEMKFLLSSPPDAVSPPVRSAPARFIYLINFQMDCPRMALFAFGPSRAASHLGIRSV